MLRNRDPRVKTLSLIDVLTGTSARELQEICSLTTEVRLPAGRVLCHQGDSAHEVFFVVDGQVAISLDGVALSVVGQGGILGEMGVLEQQQRRATVTALTDVTVLVLSAGEFTRLVTGYPRVAANVRALAHTRTEEIKALVAA